MATKAKQNGTAGANPPPVPADRFEVGSDAAIVVYDTVVAWAAKCKEVVGRMSAGAETLLADPCSRRVGPLHLGEVARLLGETAAALGVVLATSGYHYFEEPLARVHRLANGSDV